MGLAQDFARQLARPVGMAGWLLGGAMDIANRKPTRLAIDLLDPRPSESVIDAGCGTGAAMAQVLRRASCSVTGVDPSHTMLQAAQRRLGRNRPENRADFYRAGLEDLPFAPATFDAALALNVLYFCDPSGLMLGNLRRVLKPGGRLVAYVTHRETMENWPFARAGLHRLYDAPELAEALLAGGFACERIAVHEVAITRKVKGLLACAIL